MLANGQSVSFRVEGNELVIDNPPEGDFTLEIRNTCAPEKNTQPRASTPRAAASSRSARPRAFAASPTSSTAGRDGGVHVTLRAEQVALPGAAVHGNLVEQATWTTAATMRSGTTLPKPSYLFALVAADLVAREQHVRTRSGKNHLLQVWVRRGDLDKTEHAMNSLIASVVWDEARFGCRSTWSAS